MDMGKTDEAIELVSSSEELPPLLAGWSTLGLKSTSGGFTALSLRCLKLGSQRRRERIQVGLPFVERGAHGSGTICTGRPVILLLRRAASRRSVRRDLRYKEPREFQLPS